MIESVDEYSYSTLDLEMAILKENSLKNRLKFERYVWARFDWKITNIMKVCLFATI